MDDQRIFFEVPKLALTRVEAADALGVILCVTQTQKNGPDS
jgi:hypothetical protein